MTDIKKLEQKLVIDEHALDIALREHPDLFYKVASELALAISNRDGAKQELDQVESLVDTELRRAAAVSEEKTTDKAIDSKKKLDKRVVAADKKFLDERLNTAQWTALKDAYEQRSYALSKLVDLYIANYYSAQEGKGPALKDVRAQQVKEANNRERVRVKV